MTRTAMATDDFEHRATAQRFAGWLREVLSELVTHPEGVHVDAQWVATRTLRLRPGTPNRQDHGRIVGVGAAHLLALKRLAKAAGAKEGLEVVIVCEDDTARRAPASAGR